MLGKKENPSKSDRQSSPKPPRTPKRIRTWEEVEAHVYERIYLFATRFIIFSVIGVVFGFISTIYGVLSFIFLGLPLQEITTFIALFIGVGAIAASFILLAWGLFWRRKVENRTIF